MRPSKIESVRWQACGANGSPLPGTRISDAVIGSVTPRRCASVSGTRSGRRRGRRIGDELLDRAAADHHAHLVVFLVGHDARGVGRGHEVAAGGDRPARRALALAAGEDLHQAGGRPARGGREIVVGDVDDPGAASDRKPAQRDRVAGIELALGETAPCRRIRQRRRQRSCASRISTRQDETV